MENEAHASNDETSDVSKDDNKTIETLQRTATFISERYEVGMLWKGNQRRLPNNLFSRMGQLKSQQRRFETDPELKERYEETVKGNLAKDLSRNSQH